MDTILCKIDILLRLKGVCRPLSIVLHLPWPPSVNKAWRPGFSAKKQSFCFYTDPKVKIYRNTVKKLLLSGSYPKIEGDIFANITIFPARKGRVDVDNRLKVTFDALKHAGLYDDDSQITSTFIQKGPPTPPGAISMEFFGEKDHDDPRYCLIMSILDALSGDWEDG